MGKQNTTGEVVGTPAWQKWESGGVQSTTSETWTGALQRTADPTASGVYKMSWYFELRVVPTGPLDSKAAGRFDFDGNFRGIVVNPDSEWCGFSGWDFVNFNAGDTPVLRLQFRRDPGVGGNDTIEIRRLKLALEQMGPQ